MQSSIIIADDHPLILKGLNDFLLEKKYNVLASAVNGKDALELIETHKPEIAILDIQMPYYTGLEIAEKCKALNYQTKIVLITFEKDETIYKQAKSLGVYGYVLKEFALTEIEQCIDTVSKDIPYFSPELLSYLEVESTPKELETLTPTEKEVLKHIAQNKTAKEIGDLMFISNRTVEKHKSHIIKKLNLAPIQNSLLIWAKENQTLLE
ncbi:MAG: DNA-binding response regulator [Xanthomarina sp.]|uniref:response regulator n=1 Tax=Xanthomarina sp. TaxID=1931211 RepID=UPI000C5FF80C|nr:response regulator transcription factor [Xanthomarina sp.]MBF61961.1 DNA-binding response regulator [Xanthomarina sp.]HAI17447.1 DNA-binding response regulator [Xanthomarina gelatinilytica]|tara:strand:+ start:1047 stop:1673 length:627 start_codon:yes stop_codon:yes gene_type:complete